MVDALVQDNAPPGMTPLEQCQSQAKDPAIHQIVGKIQKLPRGKLKIKMETPSDLKTIIRIKKAINIETMGLYRRTTEVNRRTRLQLVPLPSFRKKAITGCCDQVGYLGQDRVLEFVKGPLLQAWDTHWCGILHQQLCQVFEEKVPPKPGSST